MPKQNKNSKLIENLESMMPTGYNTYDARNDGLPVGSKPSIAMAECTSVTTNPSMCMCSMGSVRAGLPSKSNDNTNFMCDTLDM